MANRRCCFSFLDFFIESAFEDAEFAVDFNVVIILVNIDPTESTIEENTEDICPLELIGEISASNTSSEDNGSSDIDLMGSFMSSTSNMSSSESSISLDEGMSTLNISAAVDSKHPASKMYHGRPGKSCAYQWQATKNAHL